MMRLCQVIGGAMHYMCLVSPSFRARLQLQCVEQSRRKGFWAARLFCWYRPANRLVAQGEGQALLAPALQLLVHQPLVCKWCLWFRGHLFWQLQSPYWLLLRCC